VVDKDEWLQLIEQADARMPEGEWMTGGYWDHTLSDAVFPTKEMLDEVVPDRPIFLNHIDGHYAWANTLALDLAGFAVGRSRSYELVLLALSGIQRNKRSFPEPFSTTLRRRRIRLCNSARRCSSQLSRLACSPLRRRSSR